MDHKADFILLVQKNINKDMVSIDWSDQFFICVVMDFVHYDARAVKQMSHSIELIFQCKFGKGY